ncbi:retrovirus-related pol polyprotein from transposon TNT 1-94 [Tanacetum coccineum]
MKAKLALLEASPSSSQNPKTIQPKIKGLVAETFDWDEEEVFDEEEVTQVKVLMALADDELIVGKSHARSGEWVDITIRNVNTLLSMDEDADWQNYLKYINIDLKFVEEQRLNLLSKYNKMLNHALQEQLKEEKKINEKWLTSSKKVSQCISEQIPHQKKKVLGGELFTDSSSKMNENENIFVPASMGYNQEMVPKTKDWVERLNPDSKLPKFNTGRILVPESQAVNEFLEPTETLNNLESSKDSEAKSLTLLPPLKNLQGASPSSEVMPLTFQLHSPKERPGLGIMKHTKPETHDSSNKSVSGTVTVSETKQTTPSVPTEVKDTKQESKLNALTKLVQMLIDEKVNSNKKTQESNSKIQKTESSKLVDSSKISQDSKPKVQSIGSSKSLRPKPIQKPQLKCELCHCTNHSTDDCYRILHCMICKKEDHKTSDYEMYIASLKRTPRRNDVYVLDMLSLTLNGACFFAKASESVNWLWHKRLSHLNFKNINKLAKQNKVLGLPSLVYLKDKPCIACEKGKHLRASFKTKQNFSIRKCLHLLHMDLSGLVNNQVPKVIAPNEHDIPHTEDTEGPPNLINTKGTHEQNVHNDQMITQTTDVPSGEQIRKILDALMNLYPLSYVSHTTKSESLLQGILILIPAEDRWSRDQHIKLVNIIGDPGEGMLTRSMAAKLIAASASECLFANFLSKIEPKRVSKSLKHPRWVDATQEELIQFYRNKV